MLMVWASLRCGCKQVAAQDLRQNEAAASEVEAKMSHLLGEHADG